MFDVVGGQAAEFGHQLHFSADGKSVAEIPVDNLIVPLAVIDIRETWYAFDAVKYPARVRVRLDREIMYLAGWWDSHSKAPENIPQYPLPSSTIRRCGTAN